VRVVEARRDLDLALEPGGAERDGEVAVEHLDRDLLPGGGVDRGENGGHPATA
jgi:hypothetical protein